MISAISSYFLAAKDEEHKGVWARDWEGEAMRPASAGHVFGVEGAKGEGAEAVDVKTTPRRPQKAVCIDQGR